MKEKKDKPASIFIGTPNVKLDNDKIQVAVNFIVKDDVDDFYFTSNEKRVPDTLGYWISDDNKTITLNDYPGRDAQKQPQLVFYFDTKPMIGSLYYKYFELSIVFPWIDITTYKNHFIALDFFGQRKGGRDEESETEKGIIYFPDIKPKL